ncbi:MAG: hypothetical protein GWN73_14560, partial [Actinobacteria bacterium]|nr:hypothetical protein [Actinomycetota bacterium]NIU66568.1 hypothetical protein [Actinomycetota bacterium]NIW28372.1 hypothetical protein [Actinomycetota bacterium]
GTIDRETAAAQIVEDRIERIRVEPGYASLSARYAESGTALPDHPGLARETVIARHRDSTATGITDFTRVTVTVDGTGLPRPVSRTVTVARP